MKYVQHCHVNHEIEVKSGMEQFSEQDRVRKTSLLLKSSSLHRLDPFMDRGLLKSWRTTVKISTYRKDEASNTSTKEISHHQPHYTHDAHQRLSHAGRNFVITKLRERYYIPSMNAAVRYHIHRCIACRRFRRPCSVQKMDRCRFLRTLLDKTREERDQTLWCAIHMSCQSVCLHWNYNVTGVWLLHQHSQKILMSPGVQFVRYGVIDTAGKIQH